MPFDLLFTVSSALDAVQAGGGGSFGSGSGGGGDGGDGGIGAWFLYFLIRLVFEVPIVGVPLLIIVAIVFFVGSRRGWNTHQERTIHRAQPKREARRSNTAAERLRGADPAFDAERFLARVRAAFHRAQDAWCAQDLSTLRPFVSDGVFERFSLQIAEQRRDGWRQELEGLTIGTASIQHVDVGRHFESVTARIPFTARIHRVDLERKKRIHAATLPETSFVECWTFLRRRGARTKKTGGLIEGQCPNCGAPIALNQAARCESCECLVRSGEHDWVLVEITQASVWTPEPEQSVPGLAGYAERDPGICLPALEDRASVAFWRWCAALRAGAESVDAPATPLRKLAAPEFCDGLEAVLARRGASDWAVDAAVGSARTLGVLAGEQHDRAVVEVHWDGKSARIDDDGKRRVDARRRMRRSLFVFRRRTGALSRVEDAFTATCCTSCGAADDGSLAPLCPYCDAPRIGDESVWLLDAVRAAGDAPELVRELRALGTRPPEPRRPSKESLLAWTASVLRADGEIAEEERRRFERLAADCGVAPERIEAMLALPADDDAGALQARDAEEARAWLGALVEAALADGALHARERKLLSAAAERLGIQAREVERAISAKRSALYREARRA